MNISVWSQMLDDRLGFEGCAITVVLVQAVIQMEKSISNARGWVIRSNLACTRWICTKQNSPDFNQCTRAEPWQFVGSSNVSRLAVHSTKVGHVGYRQGSVSKLPMSLIHVLYSSNTIFTANVYITCSLQMLCQNNRIIVFHTVLSSAKSLGKLRNFKV